jgi:hypothetical protein
MPPSFKGPLENSAEVGRSHGLLSVVEASQLVCGAKLRGNYKFLVYGELWSPAKA